MGDLKSLLLSYQGRINRAQFWAGFAIYLMVTYSVGHLIWEVLDSKLYSVASAVLFWPFLFALTTKRYHDQGKSGWNSLLWLIPFVGTLYVLIECGIWKGSPLRNEYGDPLFGPLVERP
ncbi:MAG: DUF805 domain-containing protein [Pseudomonadota bacterium]